MWVTSIYIDHVTKIKQKFLEFINLDITINSLHINIFYKNNYFLKQKKLRRVALSYGFVHLFSV